MDDLNTPSLKKPDQSNKKIAVWTLAILLVLALLATSWIAWQWMELNKQVTDLKSANQQLQGKVLDLTQRLAVAEGTFVADDEPCDPAVTDELKANILAAVNSGNFAALEGYMTDSVNVIIAASEGVGPQTPVQAIASMAYLGEGALPWATIADVATIESYNAGFYTDYFDENTYVLRSADGMVVVFDFDSCGKINEVFMVANEELLL